MPITFQRFYTGITQIEKIWHDNKKIIIKTNLGGGMKYMHGLCIRFELRTSCLMHILINTTVVVIEIEMLSF